MNRHWVWLGLGMALGIRLAAWTDGPTGAVLLAGLLGGTGVLWMMGGLPWGDRALVILVSTALGAALWSLHVPSLKGDPLQSRAIAHPNEPVTLEGTISETPVYLQGMEQMRFVLNADTAIEGDRRTPLLGRCLTYSYKPAGPLYDGMRVQVTGKLRPDIGAVNFGVTGLEDRCRYQSIFSRISTNAEDVRAVGGAKESFWYWISRLRQWQADRLRAVVPAEAVPFVLGVWLGERGVFDRDLYQQFVASGTVHVLSVGGMHVGLIYLSVTFLLGIFIGSRRLRAVTAMAVIVMYCLAAGAQPPALRSMVMVAVILAYEMFDREPDTLTALGLSGFVLLAFNPPGLFDLGFILSYLSMASLLLFQHPVSGWLSRLPVPARDGLAATLGAQILSAPVAAWSFYILPVAGLVANLVVVPLLGVVLWLTFVTVLLAAIWPAVAVLPGHALWLAVKLSEYAVGLGASLPAGYFVVPRPTPIGLGLWFLAAFLGYRLLTSPIPPRRRQWILAGVVAVLSVALWPSWIYLARVDFLDVGHADAACIVAPGGGVALIDGGDVKDGFDQGKMVVEPFLRSQGIRRLDAVIATHSDSDHIGGLIHIVESFPVKTAYLGPPGGKIGELESQFLTACQNRGVAVRRVAAGDVIQLKDTRLEVLNPPGEGVPGGEENDQSLVLRLDIPKMRVLFAGDVQAASEKIVAARDCKAEVLKAPHHGSATSSSEAFLDAVAPRAVVVSTREAGRLPALGKGIGERYAKHGLRLWRTDLHGGVRIRMKEDKMLIEGARDRRGYTLERSLK